MGISLWFQWFAFSSIGKGCGKWSDRLCSRIHSSNLRWKVNIVAFTSETRSSCPSERIFGYKNLQIGLYCLSSSLDFYLNIDYDEKLNPKKYHQFQVGQELGTNSEVHPSFKGGRHRRIIESMDSSTNENEQSRFISLEIETSERMVNVRRTDLQLRSEDREILSLFHSSCQQTFRRRWQICPMVFSSRNISRLLHRCRISHRQGRSQLAHLSSLWTTSKRSRSNMLLAHRHDHRLSLLRLSGEETTSDQVRSFLLLCLSSSPWSALIVLFSLSVRFSFFLPTNAKATVDVFSQRSTTISDKIHAFKTSQVLLIRWCSLVRSRWFLFSWRSIGRIHCLARPRLLRILSQIPSWSLLQGIDDQKRALDQGNDWSSSRHVQIDQSRTSVALASFLTRVPSFQQETRRVYEMSLLYATDRPDEEQMKRFRLTVKQRLFQPLQVEMRDVHRLNLLFSLVVPSSINVVVFNWLIPLSKHWQPILRNERNTWRSNTNSSEIIMRIFFEHLTNIKREHFNRSSLFSLSSKGWFYFSSLVLCEINVEIQ